MTEYAKSPIRVQSGAAATSIVESTFDRDLIVVSNRQPYRHTHQSGEVTVDRPAGGLIAGLDPALQRIGGTWIAWGDGDGDREAADEDGTIAVPPDDPSYLLERVWLTEEEVDGYYRGFANQVLWPACHSITENVSCEPGYWERYREVNERFANAAVERAEPGSLLWLQDYHFALAPRAIRPELPPRATLAHFLHIPWPDPETFRACPHGEELLRGLLGNDLLCFHVPRYQRNFLRCVDAVVDGAGVDWMANSVDHDRGDTLVEAHPMGVQAREIWHRASSSTAGSFWTSFAREHDLGGDRQVALGVDRLDYTKGIVERLRAFEHLWETRPRWRGALTYVQSASESRSSIPAYRAVQSSVADAVDRINRRFGTEDWQPVVYTTEWLDPEELAGLYRHADLAVVSPLRDGMNLVAPEYVAAQVDGDGALLLSERAGAHDLFGRWAVSVSPTDTMDFAARIEEGLTMSPAARRQRMTALRRWVNEHTLSSWVDGVLARANRVQRGRAGGAECDDAEPSRWRGWPSTGSVVSR